MTSDDFHYALENTTIIVPPRKRLETFGSSVLHYTLVTEEMDAINESRVREGKIYAERPQLISPNFMAKLMLEGFGDKAFEYAEFLSAQGHNITLLKYGFRIRHSDMTSYDVNEPMEAVVDRLRNENAQRDDPLSALLTGVDDGWEVCLLKFMIEMIQSSTEGHLGDFRKRGLL